MSLEIERPLGRSLRTCHQSFQLIENNQCIEQHSKSDATELCFVRLGIDLPLPLRYLSKVSALKISKKVSLRLGALLAPSDGLAVGSPIGMNSNESEKPVVNEHLISIENCEGKCYCFVTL